MAEQLPLDQFLPGTSGMLLANGRVIGDPFLSGVLAPSVLRDENLMSDINASMD
jgi:hypothetical protein